MMLILTEQRNQQRGGSALVAVFWMIAVLGLIVFASIRFVSTDSAVVASYKNAERARRMAEMGMAVGGHELVKKGDPALEFEDDFGRGYGVTLEKEEGRIAINEVLKAGDREVLRRLFLLWGAGEDLAGVAADSLADWVDEDDEVGLLGAESEWYVEGGMDGLPRNRELRSFEEILLVRGMAEVAELRPGWRAAFTLFGEGKVDVNSADADVIAAVAGVPWGRAETLVSVRSGYDGAGGTDDDVVFDDVARAGQILGISPEAADLRFGTEGKTERVESVGYCGNVREKLVLVQRDGDVLWSGWEKFDDEEANL